MRKLDFGGAQAESRQAYSACRLFSQHLPKSKCYQTSTNFSNLTFFSSNFNYLHKYYNLTAGKLFFDIFIRENATVNY